MNKPRINTQEFIRRSNLLHNKKYNYHNTFYVASNKKVTITCPIHGDFMQSADEHLRGRGCKECGRKKYDTEKFIVKAKQIHGDKYDYSLTKYTKSSEKILIICPKHGNFMQIANNHLSSQGCPRCAGSKKSSVEEFIEKAQKIHGNKYDYFEVEYKNNKTKVGITCKKHGVFYQKPELHTNSKQGCPKCAGLGRSNVDFIIDASEKHEDKYDYSKTCYKKYNIDVCITCPIHGDFLQKPYIHLMGSGCQKCSESKGERRISNYLKLKKITFEREKKFTGCENTKTNKSLKFDFYLPEYNLCIEYDGEYHYKPWRLCFDEKLSKDKLKEVQARDEIKNLFCKENRLSLLRIPYFDIKNVENIIENYLLTKTKQTWQ